jgi:hypothetical protein
MAARQLQSTPSQRQTLDADCTANWWHSEMVCLFRRCSVYNKRNWLQRPKQGPGKHRVQTALVDLSLLVDRPLDMKLKVLLGGRTADIPYADRWYSLHIHMSSALHERCVRRVFCYRITHQFVTGDC